MLPFAKFAPLLKYAGARFEDLTLDDMKQVAKTLGIQVNVTDELKEAGVALMRGENIHSVADMIKSPESIQQLMEFLTQYGREDRIAEAELIDMYEGDFGFPEVQQSSVPERVQPANVLISSSLTGWRLPG